jgi:hypothetical protein
MKTQRIEKGKSSSKFNLAFVLVFLFFVSASGFGQTTVSYTGMGAITCPAVPVATISPAVSGLTFSQLSRGSGVTCASVANGIAGSGFNVTLANAITNSKWYTLSITSNASTPFTLSSLKIQSLVSSASGSPSVSVQYSIGAGAKTAIGSFTPTTTSANYTITPGTPISVGASQVLNIYFITNNLTASGTVCRIINATSLTVNLPMTYVSSTTTQTNVATVTPGATSQQIIGIEVVTSGSTSPLTASSFTFNTSGTTAPADIANAKLWTTGTSSAFATTTQLGSLVATPSGSFTISSGSNLPYTLSSGTNYFWITYDVVASPILGNVVDAQCTSITVGGTAQTPSITAPSGSRTLVITYCTSTSSGSTYYLSNFLTTGGFTNIGNNSAGWSATGYGNFTAQSVSNYAGTSTNYTTTWNTIGGVGYGLWIDWNNDGDFGDANESIYVSSSYSFATSYSGTITVPVGIAAGNYRMRTKIDYNLSVPLSCGAITNGETEDYTFTVLPAPTCITPAAVTASAVTSTTATISWTAASPAPSNGYQYEVRSSGTAGSGASGLVANGNTAAGVVAVNISGLLTSNTYSVYVRSFCGGTDYSIWTSAYTFTTPCDATNIPYTQNFESVVTPAIPSCTSIQNAGTGNSWITTSPAAYGFTTKVLEYPYNANAANAWFYTQGLNLTAGTSYRLTFNYGNNSSTYTEKLKVWYGTSAVNTSMINAIVDYPAINQAAMQTSTTDFTPATSGVYYLGFNAYSAADQYYLYVDDISVIFTPTPVITSLSSASGCVGSSLVITGTDLTGATSAAIGGTAATITANTATSVTITVGSGTTGVVSVTTGGGVATSAAIFTVNQIPAAPGAITSNSPQCSGTGVTFTKGSCTTGTCYWVSSATGTETSNSAASNTTATTTGSYNVWVRANNNGCWGTSVTASGIVNEAPTAVAVTPSAATICAGSIQFLEASGGAVSVTGVIGANLLTTGTTTQPTAFCNRWPNYWSQTIYTAAELTAAGLSAGNITSMAYNITSLGDAASNANFTIKIGNTSNAVFGTTTFASTTGFTSVYGPSTYTHTASGWQTITFTTPYVWDGISNIIINVTHDGADNLYNSQTYYTATAGNTVLWVNSYTAGTTTTGATSTNRLDVKFNQSVVANTTWSPTDGLFTDAATTIAYTGTKLTSVYAKPDVSKTYTAIATASNGCSASNTVAVTINPNPTVSIASRCATTGRSIELTGIGGTGVFQDYEQQLPNVLHSSNAFAVPYGETRNYRVIDDFGCISDWTAYSAPAAPSQMSDVASSGTCIVRGANTWWHVTNASNNVIVSINDNGNDMGEITATSYLDAATSNNNNTFYLKRHFQIHSDATFSSDVTLRLYFTQAELDDLIAKSNQNTYSDDNVNGLEDLRITRYSGPNEDADFSNNDTACATCFTNFTPTYGTPVSPDLGADVRYLEISVPGFSEQWIHGPKSKNAILPIELVSFVPTCVNNKVLIRWVTASEVNNSHFNLERSDNGVDFSTIARIEGSGNSNSYTEYSYLDHSGFNQLSYYRLTQVDYDGAYKTYEPAAIHCNSVNDDIVVQPNPFKENIVVKGLTEGFTSFEISNTMGQIVYKDSYIVSSSQTVDLSALTPGLYSLKITDINGSTRLFKIVKN